MSQRQKKEKQLEHRNEKKKYKEKSIEKDIVSSCGEDNFSSPLEALFCVFQRCTIFSFSSK